MEIIIENQRNEQVKFGSLDSSVEYLQRKLHENFTVIVNSDSNSQTQQVIDRIRRECRNVLSIR